MLKATITTPDGLKEIKGIKGIGIGQGGQSEQQGSPEPGTWFNLVRPEPSELQTVSELTGAPPDLLRAALDMEESSRVEIEGSHMLIIINVSRAEERAVFAYDTIPLGIVLSRGFVTTVCLEENAVLADFHAMHHHLFDTRERTRFLFQILYRSAVLYLGDLRLMDKRTDEIEQNLWRSMKNKELFLLLNLQKALTYFTVALHSNRSVVERLVRMFQADSNAAARHLLGATQEDGELLDDVRIEYDQAIEMVRVHSDVVASTMGVMASVISNNLNIVMKFLASVTVVMAIPTLLAGFFGMNVPVPWQNNPFGFAYTLIVAVVLAILSIFLLWKKNMF